MLVWFVTLFFVCSTAYGDNMHCKLTVERAVTIENMNMLCVDIGLSVESSDDTPMSRINFIDDNIVVSFTRLNSLSTVYLSNRVCEQKMNISISSETIALCGITSHVADISNVAVVTTHMKGVTMNGEDVMCRFDRTGTEKNIHSIQMNQSPIVCNLFRCKSLILGNDYDCAKNEIRASSVMNFTGISYIPTLRLLCIDIVLFNDGIKSFMIMEKDSMDFRRRRGSHPYIKLIDNLVCRDTGYEWNMTRRSNVVCRRHDVGVRYNGGMLKVTARFIARYSTLDHNRQMKTGAFLVDTGYFKRTDIVTIRLGSITYSPNCIPSCSFLTKNMGQVYCDAHLRHVNDQGVHNIGLLPMTSSAHTTIEGIPETLVGDEMSTTSGTHTIIEDSTETLVGEEMSMLTTVSMNNAYQQHRSEDNDTTVGMTHVVTSVIEGLDLVVDNSSESTLDDDNIQNNEENGTTENYDEFITLSIESDENRLAHNNVSTNGTYVNGYVATDSQDDNVHLFMRETVSDGYAITTSTEPSTRISNTDASILVTSTSVHNTASDRYKNKYDKTKIVHVYFMSSASLVRLDIVIVIMSCLIYIDNLM